jgi:hypothetical protein
MKKIMLQFRVLLVSFLMLISYSSHALVIQEYSIFLNSPTLGGSSLLYSPIGSGENDFLGSGIDATFIDGLDADGFGTVSWEFFNNSGVSLDDAQLFVFLDAEIDQGLNTFFNESGALVDVSGTGVADNLADTWEIDEPGFLFGDIFDNLLVGALDNTNNVTAGLEEDVSLALGFELGSLAAGETWTGLFEISLLNIGGLSHTDPDSLSTFYFNGTVDVSSVPEPGILSLLSLALLGLVVYRRRRLL